MPQSPQIIATWSNVDAVNLYNVKGILETTQQSSNTSNTSNSSNSKKATANPTKIEQDPFFVYQGHSTGSYTMDWSPVSKEYLATGDSHKKI